ncbi:glycosyltransferase family 9 protein [Massilia sp. PAMC28688]|uniref:glycosyltransferase family 9 protein n=1 Tax=Massilia sp. PAMC28688 TaxID=2861283 RepID=UPI001C62FEEE|nr:glycosyltransferase family 9 protein [Massilia sp. PAMC28688]QYF92236.1 glycosyltransferase family 9 protein [Massilia sp. PAMC28688]
MNAPDWQQARHVLAVRLDSLGDVLMCTPALRAIKEASPKRSLTLLTSAGGAAGADFVPDIDAVLRYEAPWMKPPCAGLPHDLRIIEAMRAERFDAAVIFTSYSQSPLPAAMLCRLAGIPLCLAHCRENAYHLISHRVPDAEPDQMVRHEVQRQLDLVASVGWQTHDSSLSFMVPRAAMVQAQALLASHGILPHMGYVLLHPGASAPSRRYPPHLWVELVNGLYERLQCPILLSGDAAERALVSAIAAQCRAGVIVLAGELNLGQLGAVIGMARVMVANNTGPAHMAAALGTPIVSLYALTNPQHTPWQVPSRVLFHDVHCRLCHKSVCPEGHQDCLAKVAPVRVIAAVEELLAQPLPAR